MNDETASKTPTETSPSAIAPAIVEELSPLPFLDDEIVATEIIEEAEQILREGAPHDFDVLVIGGGPGGYVAAIRAAQLGAHVGLIEEREIGGVCINRGCIPTKTLLESVDVMRLLRRAGDYGLVATGEIRPDMKKINARKRAIVEQLRAQVALLLQENGVEVLQGRARFVEEHKVEITSTRSENKDDTRVVSAIHIIIASGSLPSPIAVPGHDLPHVFMSDEMLAAEIEPQDVVVIGAGAVGVEFAYLFYQLGAKSVLLERASQIMPQEDEDIGREMSGILKDIGLEIVTDAELQRIEETPDGLDVIYKQDGQEKRTSTRSVLMATGRRANTRDLGMDDVGIEHDDGKILVNENCETNVSGVYAIGDCIRNVGWAHLASGEGTMVAEIVTQNPISVDLSHVPSCYYTHPEIASVGLTRAQAEEKGLKVRVGQFWFRSNGKAAAAGEHRGFVKIVVDDETERIVGCQIIGPRATDLISEAVMALKTKQTLDEMVGAIHAHPTFSEALPEAALNARRKR